MIGFKKTTTLALLAVGIGFIGGSNASLLSRPDGMVYDTDLNITWMADANLFKTKAANNANLVSEIIAANNYDNHTGIYNLTTVDFNTSNGRMSWFGAHAWANSLTYGGYRDWRLPIITPISEMDYLIYGELGGSAYGVSAGFSIPTSNNPNYNLFSNIQSYIYWESSYTESSAWGFGGPNFGVTPGLYSKDNQFFAWAVRDGDVTTVISVPEPGVVWLFGSGLGLLTLTRRRKNQTG